MTTHRPPWPPGIPAWADLTVPDLAAARRFYGALFGWEFEGVGPARAAYTQALLDGRRVVGLGGPSGSAAAPPPAWCLYLATDDLSATTAAIERAGGRTIVAPEQIAELGAMGLYADAAGAVFGLWRPGTHTGWDVVEEPGSVVWSEVMVHDQPRALAFYREVFGLGAEDLSAPGFMYGSLTFDDVPVAGVGAYAEAAAGAPPAWTLYFGVADADASAALVGSLGGTVISPPASTPFGRMAIVAGPFGEVFALMAQPSPDQAH